MGVEAVTGEADVMSEVGRRYGAKADFAHDVRLARHGLDPHDNDFVIGLVGKELHPLSHVVQAMRATRQTAELAHGTDGAVLRRSRHSSAVRRMIRAIVFDLDGTLIDPRRDIAASTNHALSMHGFPSSRSKRSWDTSATVRALLACSARLDDADARLDTLVDAFLDLRAAHPIDSTTPGMPGAREVLAEFASPPLAPCTQ